MNLEPHMTPPSWVFQPKKLQEALEHSMYFDAEFLSTVQVSEPDKFSGGIRSFLYWRRQLAPSITELSVMFVLLGPTGILPMNVMNVMTGAMRAFCLQHAVEFSQGANSNFLAVSFRSAADATLFRETFRYFGDAVIAYVRPATTTSHRYSMLWLPPLFDINKVRALLGKYCTNYSTIKGSLDIGGGQYMPSSVIRGTLDLKCGTSINDLPHLIPLPAPHIGYALLIIADREPFCLKCLRSGHMRKNCNRPRCLKCRFYHMDSENCDRSSYASKVSKTPGAVEKYCWMDDVSVLADILDPSSVASASAVESISGNDMTVDSPESHGGDSLQVSLDQSGVSSDDGFSSVSVVMESCISEVVPDMDSAFPVQGIADSRSSPLLTLSIPGAISTLSSVDEIGIVSSLSEVELVPPSLNTSKDDANFECASEISSGDPESDAISDGGSDKLSSAGTALGVKRLRTASSDEMDVNNLQDSGTKAHGYLLRNSDNQDAPSIVQLKVKRGQSGTSAKKRATGSKKR